jgi:MFS family permease
MFLKREDLFGFLTILLFIIIVSLTYGDQNIISPNLKYITESFGFGDDTSPLGVLTFFFTLLTAFSMALFGFLTDRYTRKWICFFGSLIYSISSIITILVPDGILGYVIFFFTRALNGIGLGAIVPTIFSLIGDLVSKEDRSKGYSFFSIATLLGAGIGIVLASNLYPIIPNWRLPFMIMGISILIFSILLIFVKEPSRIGKQETLKDLMVDKDAVVYSYQINISDLKEIYKRKSNFWLIINFVDTIPTGIILFLIFIYFEDVHNIKPDNATNFLIIIMLATLIGTLFFGYLADKWFKAGNKKARVLLALIGNIAPIPLVYIALLIPYSVPDEATTVEIFSNPFFIITLVLFAIGLFANGGTNAGWYATVVDVNLPENRGTVLATANFFDIIGRAIGPLIGSIIATNISLTAGMASSIIFWIFLPFFWIPVMRNVIKDMERVDSIFNERLENIKKEIK